MPTIWHVSAIWDTNHIFTGYGWYTDDPNREPPMSYYVILLKYGDPTRVSYAKAPPDYVYHPYE